MVIESCYLIACILIKFKSPSFETLLLWNKSIKESIELNILIYKTILKIIAFYNYSDWEKKHINEKFLKLINQIKYLLYKRYLIGIFDSILVKYGTIMISYSEVRPPVFTLNSV